MTTDIDKLAQQMREAAGKATPGPWEAHEIDPNDPEWEAFEIWNEAADDEMIAKGAGTASVRVFGRANANYLVLANPAAVLALLDDRERLVAEAAAAKVTMEMAATSGAFWARRAERAEASLAAKEQECERLREALKNAAGFIDTPVMRRRHGGEQFYSAVVDSVRAVLATSGGGNG